MTSQPSDIPRKVAQLSGDMDFLIAHVDDVERRIARRITDLRRETRAQFTEMRGQFAEILRRLPEPPE